MMKNEVECINIEPLKGNDKAPDLVLGKIYSLRDIVVCGCGEKHYNVGLPMVLNYVECYKCREILSNSCHSSRFKGEINE